MRRVPGDDSPELDPIHPRLPDGQTVPVPGYRTWAEMDASKDVRLPSPRPWHQRLPWLLLLVAVIAYGLWACGAIP